MDQDLIDYVTTVMAIADLRNLSDGKAVVFKIDVGNGNNILVVVSYTEPDYRQYPFNVIWIPADPISADFEKVLRRYSKTDAGGYQNTWNELTAFADLTSELQYYDTSDDNTFLLGELGIHGQVQPANQTRSGIVLLGTAPVDPLNPLAVVTGDPRMSDARTPVAHSHPAQPFTHLVGSVTLVSDVEVHTSAPPVAGQTLKITGQIGGDSTKLTGEWVTLTSADIQYTGPSFDSLTITGPIFVEENSTITLQATANFSDTSTQVVTPTWSVITGSVATIDAAGVVTGLPVAADTQVTIQASYFHAPSGVTQTATYNVTVTDNAVPTTLVSIAINGTTSVDEGNQATYTVTATYSDTSTALITPDVLTVPANLGSIVLATGIFTALADVNGDQTGNIHAEYDDGNGNQTADLSITVNDTTKTPASIAITGPANIDESTTGQFVATVTYTDTTTAQVVATWSNDISAAGSINPTTGQYTANAVTVDTADVVNVTYTENSVTVTDTFNTQVDDVPVVLSSITISGATTIQEGNSATYTVTGTYSDSSTADLTGSVTWSIPTGGSFASFVSNTLTANAVTGNQSVVIQADVDVGDGTGNHTDTHNITIEDTPVYPLYGAGPANAAVDDTFMQTYLTNQITGSSPQIITTADGGQYIWLAFPLAQITHASGQVQIQNLNSGFTEVWEGANAAGDYDFVVSGPQIITYNGETWYLYRTDFSGGYSSPTNLQLTWEA